MKLEDFPTETYVRRPFQVQAFEITPDNIAELAPHVGELCDDNGTPFIKSDKKKVGNNFKVWPGFFATVLKGHVRCYSRKTFFEQFAELNDKTSPVVDFLHGRKTIEQMIASLTPEEVVGEPDREEAPSLSEEALAAEPDGSEDRVETPAEPLPTCSHGTPEGTECPYRPCDGVETEEEDDVEEADDSTEVDEHEQLRTGLESVIKS